MHNRAFRTWAVCDGATLDAKQMGLRPVLDLHTQPKCGTLYCASKPTYHNCRLYPDDLVLHKSRWQSMNNLTSLSQHGVEPLGGLSLCSLDNLFLLVQQSREG